MIIMKVFGDFQVSIGWMTSFKCRFDYEIELLRRRICDMPLYEKIERVTRSLSFLQTLLSDKEDFLKRLRLGQQVSAPAFRESAAFMRG